MVSLLLFAQTGATDTSQSLGAGHALGRVWMRCWREVQAVEGEVELLELGGRASPPQLDHPAPRSLQDFRLVAVRASSKTDVHHRHPVLHLHPRISPLPFRIHSAAMFQLSEESKVRQSSTRCSF
jgi:hypothetical protein